MYPLWRDFINNLDQEVFELKKLKAFTIKKMALYETCERPEGAAQELDRLIIDSVQIRASFDAVEKAISDQAAQSLIFQNYLIGTVYSVGVKLRKLLDKQSGVVSLNSIWELWYKNDEAKSILQNLSSDTEVEYIWSTLKSPNRSKYKTAWKYLQIVLRQWEKINCTYFKL